MPFAKCCLAAAAAVTWCIIVPVAAGADQVVPSPSVTNGLVVRSAPDGQAGSVGSLMPGQSAELLDDVPYWYKIKLGNGVKGFVWKGLADVTPDPPPVISDDLLGALQNVAPLARDAAAMNIHEIDVGQGAAILLEFPCGTVLIDTGGEDNPTFAGIERLVTYLEAFFTGRPDLGERLDLLLLTHPHKDHTFGACKVIERFKPKHLVDNGTPGKFPGKPGQECLQEAGENGTPYQGIALDDVDTGGLTNGIIDPLNCDNVDPEIRILFGNVSPSLGWGTTAFKEGNNHSVVVRVTLAQFSMLVTGDLEERGIKELLERSEASGVLEADVYQVGHHGSKNGTTDDLLLAITPAIALIGMGDDVREGEFSALHHGHPNKVAIDLLLAPAAQLSPRTPVTKQIALKGQFGTTGPPSEWTTMTIDRAIYGTGWDGSIIVHAEADGSAPVVTTSR